MLGGPDRRCLAHAAPLHEIYRLHCGQAPHICSNVGSSWLHCNTDLLAPLLLLFPPPLQWLQAQEPCLPSCPRALVQWPTQGGTNLCAWSLSVQAHGCSPQAGTVLTLPWVPWVAAHDAWAWQQASAAGQSALPPHCTASAASCYPPQRQIPAHEALWPLLHGLHPALC